jgi:hypothetical protein
VRHTLTRPRQRIEKRYAIERELGEGGMATLGGARRTYATGQSSFFV